MSETRTVTIPKDTLLKLENISKKFDKLNTGSTGDTFWIAGASTGGYSWEQIDFGVTKSGKLVSCSQSGCSCNGPEQPTEDTEYSFDDEVTLEEGYDPYMQEAVDDLVGTIDIIYKVLNDESVSPKEVISLPNAEVRRAVVELIGYDKIVGEAEVLDESDTDGKLLKIPLERDEDIVLLHVKDPSTIREYFLRVPPKMKTAKEARAWTFGFEAKDFVLDKET